MENIYIVNNSIVKSDNILTLEEYSLNFISKILNDHYFCSSCEKCKNIHEENADNLFSIGDFKSPIEKEKIIRVINNFSFSNIKKDKKNIMIIKGIENSNITSQNSLLTWLENTPNNTFVLFLSVKTQKIIATLKSRLSLFDLDIRKNYNLISEEEEKIVNLFLKINDLNYYMLYNELLKFMDINFTEILNKIAIKLLDKNSISNYYISKEILEIIKKIEDQPFLNKKILTECMIIKIISRKNELLKC